MSAAFGLSGMVTTATASAEDAVNIHHVSAEVCNTCHQEIYKQWKESMHSQSTALADPLHGAFYQQEAGSPTEEGVLHKKSGKYPVCLSCHAPNAAIDKTTKLDAKPAYAEGVNCVACHILKSYKGIKDAEGKQQLGLKAYEVAKTLQGPAGFPQGLAKLTAGSDPFGGAGAAGADASKKPNPHLGAAVEFEGKQVPAMPMESNPSLMKSSDACMGCHDQRDNPHGVPLCQTGNEYMDSGTNVNCLSCHMPMSGGLTDHTMGGGHNKALLSRSALFDVKTEKADGKVLASVRIKNQQPHSLPTGAPFRNMFVKLTAYNDKGEVVWESAKGHPVESDPQAYFSYSMVDDAGKPAPPPVATKPGPDSRLKPHEDRTLSYEIPAEGVVLVRGELYYGLLWPGLAKQFSQLPEDVRTPILVAAVEREIAP
jgi:nitrate/TMAO reductase-like tetraheme cytochrome c subunit